MRGGCKVKSRMSWSSVIGLIGSNFFRLGPFNKFPGNNNLGYPPMRSEDPIMCC